MTIDDKLLQNLLGFRDEIGILTFYVGFTPDQAADPQPRAPIELRNQIRALRQRLKESEPHDRWQAIEKRLDALEANDIGGILDAKAQGRGRALFVAVSDGRSEQVSLQMPFRERVIFDELPYVRPLVAAYDEGRPAGIVVAYGKGARLLEWSTGEAEELDQRDFELTDAQLADIKSGPSGNNPRMQQRGLVNRERFEDRIDENRHRFLKTFVEDVQTIAADRNWDRIVIAGAPKIRDEVHDAYPAENGRLVLKAEQLWEETAPNRIAEEVWPILRSVHQQREVDLVNTAKDRALSGNAGALGLKRVLEALNQGRVAHLLFDNELNIEGYRTDNGTLHAEVAGMAAEAGYEMRKDPLLVERMVEKVMEMGGHVTPLEGDAADLLADHDGVAALLRW